MSFLEVEFKVWCDHDEEPVVVRNNPDSDDVKDMLITHKCAGSGSVTTELYLTVDAAKLLVKAIQHYIRIAEE